ncbi:MAG: RNA methyltransferase [Saprospiraceae bacterium]|nr:RNA methyltransferase [Saprospiraceae bacterium]
MFSKQQLKLLKSLKIKKYRHAHQLFIAEGKKVVAELANSPIEIESMLISEDFLAKNEHPPVDSTSIQIVSNKILAEISGQSTPDGILALAKMPQYDLPQLPTHQWIIVLDHLQDPGNLGTILRIADWFGIEHVICSSNCVDVYNSKTIQATMGAIARVKTHYTDLNAFLSNTTLPIYATAMAGQSIYQLTELQPGIILIGNEANGIQQPYLDMSTATISIPKRGGGESLNAAIATGIVVSHLLNTH